MPKAANNRETSSTSTTYEVRRPVSTASAYITVPDTKRQTERNGKNIETAVYTYVRALRTLGKTQVNTAEIARALGVPVSSVDRVLSKLSERGIRRAG